MHLGTLAQHWLRELYRFLSRKEQSIQRGAGKKAQWLKDLATNPRGPSLIPRAHMVEGEN